MSSVFTAKPVIVPNDMAERFDKQTGQQEGFLRNLIADGGNLHQLDEELLAIGLMSSVKGLMEDKNLPDDTKPLTVERLSNVLYVLMFAYCTGTMHVHENGEVSFGQGLDDVRKAIDLATSKEIKFANGRTIAVDEFMYRLKSIVEPKSVEKTYDKVVKRYGLTKRMTPQAAFAVAKLSIMASKVLIKGK